MFRQLVLCSALAAMLALPAAGWAGGPQPGDLLGSTGQIGGSLIDVDPGTGQVTGTRRAAAADAGKAINPLACVQQIDGAAIMGLGMAMMEEVAFDGGRTLNPTFLDYKVPTTLDVPVTDPIVVESGHDEGTYGAKGVGESSLSPVPAALGNAVYDAVGVQVKDGQGQWVGLEIDLADHDDIPDRFKEIEDEA